LLEVRSLRRGIDWSIWCEHALSVPPGTKRGYLQAFVVTRCQHIVTESSVQLTLMWEFITVRG